MTIIKDLFSILVILFIDFERVIDQINGLFCITGYALPKFTQLTVTSYYASSSASHYGISLLTRHIEEAHTSGAQRERLS